MFAPLWVPAVVLASASQPGLLGVASAGLDHCVAHAHRHHLCWLHMPHVSGHLAERLVPGAVATPVALVPGAEAGAWGGRRGARRGWLGSDEPVTEAATGR